jgi:predicted metal-dependent hydrolase
MSHKSGRIAALIVNFQGQELDAHYLGFFDCFNRQRFYEAHEVLEELWLAQRGGSKDRFYKGLIQLAGAFVHVQQNRPGPAVALLKLAQENLARYPAPFDGLDTVGVGRLIEMWLKRLECDEPVAKLLHSGRAPELRLEPGADAGG